MPLDPQAQALIASMVGAKPVDHMTAPEMRDGLEQRTLVTGGTPEPVDQVISGEGPGAGGAIPVRIYVPQGSRPLPGLVFFHGGGWARGSLNTHDPLCRSLANAGGCTGVSAAYRV